MNPAGQSLPKIEPEFLGPLKDRPLADGVPAGAQDVLFPGATAFLNSRNQNRRLQQWNIAAPLARKLLQPDEHILHVAPAMQNPPALHFATMGVMAFPYHQVMLVLTDRRIIEVLLEVRGKKAATRLRSFPWTSVRALKLSFSNLALTPARGRKQTWKLPLRGDRALLKLLVARLSPRLLERGEGGAEPLPLAHCPQCAVVLPPKADSCGACRAAFRSPKLAAALSLAFPGAGLFYAGHPWLAAGDFLGEVPLYVVFLLLMLQAEPGAVMVAAAIGALFFVLTKLESVHLSHILLASRTRPEAPVRRSKYRKLALAGGLASLMLVVAAFPLAGAARPVLERDIDISGDDSAWQGSRSPAEWISFADDSTARSQWTHSNGAVITLFAYPLGMLDAVTEFRAGVRQGFLAQGLTMLKEDEDVPAPFEGFRFILGGETDEGQPLPVVNYYIVDSENRDIHHAMVALIDAEPDFADELSRDLIGHAHWVEATPPVNDPS